MSTLSVRRPLALLAVLGMVAALLFAVVGTASAATVPGSPAQFSACPDNADIPDAGFDDVPSGSYISDSTDCLAYYGVTKGTTSSTYSPLATITRVQMAVFLSRAAASAGVSLNASPPSAGFTDIGTASAEAQDAINALADAGIVKGKTLTTFAPSDPVSRTQMALFLTRFLAEAVTGPGGIALASAATSGAPFTDIAGASTEAKTAINQAWDLVITTGTTATTYGPDDSVTRAQMSLFTTRMMAHANTRPAGVNIQANPMVVDDAIFNPAIVDATEYSVTVRNTDFTAKSGALVDAFSFESDKSTDTPFNTDGSCDLTDTDLMLPGVTPECTLDGTDGAADANGNFPIYDRDMVEPFLTLYAWTGASGAVFNSLGTTYSSVVVTGVPEILDWDWVDLEVNGLDGEELETMYHFHLGDTVTWTAQLMDEDKKFAEAGVEITFNDYQQTGDYFEGADFSFTTTVVETDATGKASYSQTETVESWHDVTIEWDFGGTGTHHIQWSANPSELWSLGLSTPTEYQVIGTTAGSSPNTMTAMVYDQYGDLYTGTGETVQFYRCSDAFCDNDGGPVVLVGGMATRAYSWDWADGSAYEQLQAWVVDSGFAWDDGDYYWALEGVDDDYSMGPVVDDVDNNAVVGWFGADYWVLRWDSGDTFLDGGAASSQTAFEKSIKAGNGFNVLYEATPADDSVWNLWD